MTKIKYQINHNDKNSKFQTGGISAKLSFLVGQPTVAAW